MNLFWKKSKEKFSATMGWRYLKLIEDDNAIFFQMEPMVGCPDTLYVPDNLSWQQTAPDWARDKKKSILGFISNKKWNRDFEIKEVEATVDSKKSKEDSIIPGTIESTDAGRKLESARLFDPNSSLTKTQAHEVWEMAEVSFAKQLKGKIHLFIHPIIENSVTNKLTLPALKNNPNIELVFHES